MITIIEAQKKSIESLKESLLKLMKDIDYKSSNSKIFLKPNIVDAVSPNIPTITHPNVIGGIILALHDNGAKKFVIGENSEYFSFKEEHFERLL